MQKAEPRVTAWITRTAQKTLSITSPITLTLTTLSTRPGSTRR
uniref:Uncharacterized protein n=1 Tax=Arundo donax TaxID=35708 RepID=A0A0A8YV18_ARUDO